MNKRFDEQFLTDPYEKGIIYCEGEEMRLFIQSEIDRAVTEERARIVDMIKGSGSRNFSGMYAEFARSGYDTACNDILSLITKDII